MASALAEIATTYNATRPVVANRCVAVSVRAADARETLTSLTSPQPPTGPAAWIPQSSVWSAALTVAKPDAIAGQPASLVTSPVVVASRPELLAASGNGGEWLNAPYLTYENAFAAYGEFKITGSARMAMPVGPGSDATALVAQAYAYNATLAKNPDAGPLSGRAVAAAPIQTGLGQLVHNPPKVGDGSAEAAVRAIAAAPDVEAARVRTVPISEQQLYLATRDWKQRKLGVFRPHGATPVLDYPVIRLSGAPSYSSDAVDGFIAYAKSPTQIARLTRLGFRGPGPLPAATPNVDFPALRRVMPTAQPGGAVAVSRVVLPSAE
ncbi:hypothetical protein [Gordonia sp. (in: high G+C Gram-positive bacteria)]|uniref:hypothetical protein n=1 Tax=Gordonia sp. (in: high G+C Gram-positive bacteria) TaxID=84139 RepID=UPI0039E46705